MRSVKFIALIVGLSFFSTGSSTGSSAVRADEPASVWGMSAGDRFVVSAFIVKQTEVTVENEPPVTTDTRDRFEVEYQVLEVRKSGDMMVSARLKRATREVGEASPAAIVAASQYTRSLEDLRLRLLIDSSGNITSIDLREREAVLAALSGLDPTATPLMKMSCPDEVIMGWFGRPFWTARTLQSAGEAPLEFPERQDAIAMGPFGTLRTTVRITLKEASPTEEQGTLSVEGSGRFVPLVVPENASLRDAIPLSDFSADLDMFSGSIRMKTDETSDAPDAQKTVGPDFQSLELSVRLHGEATQPGQSGALPRKVSFRQTQIQMWVVMEVVSGRSDLIFGVPAPADAR